MISAPPHQLTASRSGHGRFVVRLLLVALPWILAAALVVTNMLTLLSERAYGAGQTALVPVIDTVLNNWLPPSPHRKELKIAMEANRELSRQNRVLAERQRVKESALSALQRENKALKEQQINVENRFRKLESEHIQLQETRAAIEKDRDALKDDSAKRAKSVRTLANRITGKLAMQAGDIIAELPLRGAPYVGIFTLVAGTALDIQSDCELARTLNDLVIEHGEAPVDTNAVCQYADKIPKATEVWSTVQSRASSLVKPLYQAIERLHRW